MRDYKIQAEKNPRNVIERNKLHGEMQYTIMRIGKVKQSPCER
jgi:hypothetical protein